MKKSDYICLFLSIIINIGIILALTVFSKDTTQEILDAEQIKIGLVAVENDASTKFRGEKNVDAKKQNLDADSIEKKEEKTEKPEKPTEKKVEEIKTEKTVEKITEKPEKKAAEKPAEKLKEKTPEKPVEKKVEKLAEKGEKVVEKKDEKKALEKPATKENSKKNSSEKPSLADLKKQISGSQPKTSNGGYSPTADPDGEEVVDRVLQNVTYSNGLVSGSKMGNSSDGRVVDWNAKNKVPEFPQAAKSSGKHGKLKIKLKVDKMGNVLSFVIVEGSGVPEIDAAVERVVGTWRVKLMKNGKPVNGTFYLNYNFDFK